MILCIDDEPVGLRIRKLLLENAGYQVLTALSGREGLEIFDPGRVKAVILDYRMPEMNGGQVAEELKRRAPGVPILMLSAYLDLPEEARAWVDACAIKGDSPIEFLAAVRRLVEKLSQPGTNPDLP